MCRVCEFLDRLKYPSTLILHLVCTLIYIYIYILSVTENKFIFYMILLCTQLSTIGIDYIFTGRDLFGSRKIETDVCIYIYIYICSIQNINSYELIPGTAHLISQHCNIMLLNFVYLCLQFYDLICTALCDQLY
jgi:hypothetical protein